ncbi:hypothetical protein [Pseudonocardia sp.]|uniref:hypothetical protein n=1 Tax=Pseudonocardia sp. TaxID=60912 RepID=UPI0026361856|nr:hypothetical protein [Pseudonocardia sp.]
MGDGNRTLLGRIDAAAPVDAIEVAEAELVDVVGARDVCLLICDYTGRAVVRFDRASWARAGVRRRDDETTETVPLAGTAYERVLRTQRIDVEQEDGGAVVRAPVTVRGDAIGVLELRVPQPPVAATLVEVAEVAQAFGYVVVANRRYTPRSA